MLIVKSRINNKDFKKDKKNIKRSNKSRSNYYSIIANKIWRDKNNYDLCIDSSIGNDNVVKIICTYVKNNKL